MRFLRPVSSHSRETSRPRRPQPPPPPPPAPPPEDDPPVGGGGGGGPLPPLLTGRIGLPDASMEVTTSKSLPCMFRIWRRLVVPQFGSTVVEIYQALPLSATRSPY